MPAWVDGFRICPKRPEFLLPIEIKAATRAAPAASRSGLLSAIADLLGRRPELAAAYVYGSAAAGTATPLSDIDVALVTRTGFPEERRGALLRELTVELGRGCPGAPPFDIRFLDELPVAIAGRAIAEGVRVTDNEPARRVAIEVNARMAYHDFLSFERAGTRAGLRGLRQAVRRG